MRWFVLLLLIANLGVCIWGLMHDRPLNDPLPEVPQAPGQIRLLAEPGPSAR